MIKKKHLTKITCIHNNFYFNMLLISFQTIYIYKKELKKSNKILYKS